MRLTTDAQVELNRIWPADLQVWPDDRTSDEIMDKNERRKVREEKYHRKMMQPVYDAVRPRR